MALQQAFRYGSKFLDEYVFPSFLNKNAKLPLVQLFELIQLAARTKYWPHNYYKFNGHLNSSRLKEIECYIPGRMFDALRDDLLNQRDDVFLLDDKLQFNRILRFANIPCTQILGVYRKGIGLLDCNMQPQPVSVLESANSAFVMKPMRGSAQGDGVNLVEIGQGQTFLLQGTPPATYIVVRNC